MEINNKLALTANDLASLMLNIGSYWNTVYEVHNEDIGLIEREGFDLKKRFYRLMNTIRAHYTQGLATLQDIKTELKIAEAEEVFDVNRLQEILIGCESLVVICNAGAHANRRLIAGAQRFKERTEEEKTSVGKTFFALKCSTVGLGAIGYFTSAMFNRYSSNDCHKIQVLKCDSSNINSGLGTALNSVFPLKGVILTAAIFMILSDWCKTGLLDKLIELENKVTDLVRGLHKFGGYVKEAVLNLKNCINSITKNLNFVGHSAARVRFQAGKMIERVEDLTSDFKVIKAMAKESCLIWCNELAAKNPNKLLHFLE